VSAPQTAARCERCGRASAACRELSHDECGIRVRDGKDAAWRNFVACPSCALTLVNQAAAGRKRTANAIRLRERRVPRKAVEALRAAVSESEHALAETASREPVQCLLPFFLDDPSAQEG
jgi:hypothetical protein